MLAPGECFYFILLKKKHIEKVLNGFSRFLGSVSVLLALLLSFSGFSHVFLINFVHFAPAARFGHLSSIIFWVVFSNSFPPPSPLPQRQRDPNRSKRRRYYDGGAIAEGEGGRGKGERALRKGGLPGGFSGPVLHEVRPFQGIALVEV